MIFRPVHILLPLVFLASFAATETYRLKGSVNQQLGGFEVVVHAERQKESSFHVIHSIDVEREGKVIQTLDLPGDPPAVQVLASAVDFEDVNCDGYKDLLVEYEVNNHGDSWNHLYLYQPATGTFLRYPAFSELPFQSVNCQTKTVSTYVNEGSAGCSYTAAEYRWSGAELVPVRRESQNTNGNSTNSFKRTIETWQQGKHTSRSKIIPEDDCHSR